MEMERGARPNRFEVDLAAIAHNTGLVRQMVGRSTRIIAALKADAYGFGLLAVADTVLGAGADAVAVADVADAIRLRHHGVRAPILLYPSTVADPGLAAVAQQYDLMPTIVDEESFRAYADGVSVPTSVWVKVDAGAGRLGVPAERAVALIKAVSKSGKLTLDGVYTHLHVPAGERAEEYAAWQFETFEKVLRGLDAEGVHVPWRMAASTAPLLLSSRMTLNAVDPGQMLYGITPSSPTPRAPALKPAFRSLTSRLIQVKPVGRHPFPELAPLPVRAGMRIGVIPMGFVDGLRSVSAGYVLVRGKPAMLGPVSIEHTRVDLTDVPEAEVGDEVVIIGRQGSAEIRPQQVAERNQLKEAELAVAVRNTVPRVYAR